MHLKEKTTQKLIEIMRKDYGVSLNDDEADQFGLSLLRLTKIVRGLKINEPIYARNMCNQNIESP